MSLVKDLVLSGVSPIALMTAMTALAGGPAPYPGTEVRKTGLGFGDLRSRLEAAVAKNDMLLVTTASASVAAKARGVAILGNAVLGVFRPDFAVRMLAASVAAGIEAPLRFYLTENTDGTATLTYRMPSAVFAPYGSAPLDAMAEELDVIWSRIVADAIGS
jgi:uncharacterized protein (DUF302 family)